MGSEASDLGPRESIRWRYLRKRKENDCSKEEQRSQICTSTGAKIIFFVEDSTARRGSFDHLQAAY